MTRDWAPLHVDHERGIYITMEGPDCCGKSTQQQLLAERLRNLGYEIVETKQPGGSNFGGFVRKILLSPEYSLSPISELLLFYADRHTHHEELIKPSLQQKKIVIGDRDYDSSIAYQHYGRGLDMDVIRKIHDVAVGEFKPDMTLLYDGPIEYFLQRVPQRKKQSVIAAGESRFDDEQLQFHQLVRSGYLQMAAHEPERFYILDATQEVETLHQQTFSLVEKILNTRTR